MTQCPGRLRDFGLGDQAAERAIILYHELGYLLKNTPPVKLLEALSAAVAGGSPMSPAIA